MEIVCKSRSTAIRRSQISFSFTKALRTMIGRRLTSFFRSADNIEKRYSPAGSVNGLKATRFSCFRYFLKLTAPASEYTVPGWHIIALSKGKTFLLSDLKSYASAGGIGTKI